MGEGANGGAIPEKFFKKKFKQEGTLLIFFNFGFLGGGRPLTPWLHPWTATFADGQLRTKKIQKNKI